MIVGKIRMRRQSDKIIAWCDCRSEVAQTIPLSAACTGDSAARTLQCSAETLLPTTTTLTCPRPRQRQPRPPFRP